MRNASQSRAGQRTGAKRNRRRAVCLLLAVVTACFWRAGARPALADTPNSAPVESLQPVLPPALYAVPGVEMSVYFDNIVLTQTPENYHFSVDADLGGTQERRWTVTPTDSQVGKHDLTFTVRDNNNAVLGTAHTVLHVVPAAAGAGRSINLLIVGDSLTHAAAYPNEIARLLGLPGNPQATLLGTFHPGGAHDNVFFEGYGGWTWDRFVSWYNPNLKPTDPPQARSSPFVFLEDGKPTLDVDRYFNETLKGQRPDYITILLGINDMFHFDPDKDMDNGHIEAGLTAMFAKADTLVAALRKAAPNADLGIGITTPPNSRESGFEANYHGSYHRWGWKRIQFLLAQRELQHWQGMHDDHIFVVPTETNLDPVDGFPVNNGVHPNGVGYVQIGATFYSWLKWRLAEGGPVAH